MFSLIFIDRQSVNVLLKCTNMQMKYFYAVVISAILSVSGCVSNHIDKENTMKETIKAFYSEHAINVDGVLNEFVWQKATAYPLYLSKDKIDAGEKIAEKGEVRFAWDDEYFYLAASFEDSDVVAKGSEDQMHHYRYGDLCELFLKPMDYSFYWELYVTPANKKTSFFFKQKGALDFENYSCGLKVAANCLGTLNNSEDKDKGWIAEMAMPIKDLESVGCKFGQGVNWRILAGRYNYSRYLADTELSMTPQLSKTNYHLIDEYADLELIR